MIISFEFNFILNRACLKYRNTSNKTGPPILPKFIIIPSFCIIILHENLKNQPFWPLNIDEKYQNPQVLFEVLRYVRRHKKRRKTSITARKLKKIAQNSCGPILSYESIQSAICVVSTYSTELPFSLDSSVGWPGLDCTNFYIPFDL